MFYSWVFIYVVYLPFCVCLCYSIRTQHLQEVGLHSTVLEATPAHHSGTKKSWSLRVQRDVGSRWLQDAVTPHDSITTITIPSHVFLSKSVSTGNSPQYPHGYKQIIAAVQADHAVMRRAPVSQCLGQFTGQLDHIPVPERRRVLRHWTAVIRHRCSVWVLSGGRGDELLQGPRSHHDEAFTGPWCVGPELPVGSHFTAGDGLFTFGGNVRERLTRCLSQEDDDSKHDVTTEPVHVRV